MEVGANCVCGCYVVWENKIRKKLLKDYHLLNQLFDLCGIWYGVWDFLGRGGNVCRLLINIAAAEAEKGRVLEGSCKGQVRFIGWRRRSGRGLPKSWINSRAFGSE